MTPGVHEMSMEQYHADPCPVASLSSGIAHRIITQSPLHAWFSHPKLNPRHESEEATTFDLGACAHAVLLEGEGAIAAIDPNEYPGKKGGIPDGWTNQAIRDARDKARAEGKIPVLKDKLAEIRTMSGVARKALAGCKGLKIELDSGMAERVLIWQEGDVWCRARPDWMSADRQVMLDYKSTAGSAEPSSWIRLMVSMGCDIQSIHYQRGNAMTGGPKLPTWVFLVQENYAPYACSFVSLDPAMHEIAKGKWEYGLSLWGHCMQRNQWNGYSSQIAYAEPTPWQLADDESRRNRVDQAIDIGAFG